jgi:hypothetical protein
MTRLEKMCLDIIEMAKTNHHEFRPAVGKLRAALNEYDPIVPCFHLKVGRDCQCDICSRPPKYLEPAELKDSPHAT